MTQLAPFPIDGRAVASAPDILRIENLTLDIQGRGTVHRILDGITITCARRETVGLVGESGSGKSMTLRAAVGLQPAGSTLSGSIRIAGREVIGAASNDLLAMRRELAGMIFQDPRAHVNPYQRIGAFVADGLRYVRDLDQGKTRAQVLSLLDEVGLPNPVALAQRYAHELSGGMLQRVMIAAALSTQPPLLLADEATTALDVTTRAEIMGLLGRLRDSRGLAVLFVTHDLDLASASCDRLYVMQAGKIVEHGKALDVFNVPSQPYTQSLLAAMPSRLGSAESVARSKLRNEIVTSSAPPILRVEGLKKSYGTLCAVDAIRFEIPEGGALGIVGESGSGKSTLSRLIAGIEPPDEGVILVSGDRLTAQGSRQEKRRRAKTMQMVFQDPYHSLDPRQTAEQAIDEIIALHTGLTGQARSNRRNELLDQVDLPARARCALPRDLSGGQRQRVAIARALAASPRLLLLDEATSALDVSVQAQILELLAHIRKEFGVALIVVSHDLEVVRSLTDDLLVMFRGAAVETGRTRNVLDAPQHPYTRLLLGSVPRPGLNPEQVSVDRRRYLQQFE